MASNPDNAVVPRAVAPPPPPAAKGSTLRQLVTIAWLAILLGMAMEAVMLAVAAGYRAAVTPAPFVADLAQKVSWAFVVCVGLGIGSALGRAKPAAMGVLGLIAAPLGFNVARVLHKGLAAALGVAVMAGPAPFAIAALKASQYALLGFALGHLGRRGAGALAHAATGLLAGALFGVPVIALTTLESSAGQAVLVARSLNELLFPLGCSLVIYAAEVLSLRRA